jgi:hypothetical protein
MKKKLSTVMMKIVNKFSKKMWKKTSEKEDYKEDIRTAKEKSEEYKANQMKVHNSILEKLKKEEEDINLDP